MEYDAETTLNHTQFRQYTGIEGRWLSPDPYGESLKLANPQSLNRYIYVVNNPLNLTDPLGLVPTENDMTIDQGGGGKCAVDGIDYPCGFIMLSRSRTCLLGCTIGGYQVELQEDEEQEQAATNNNATQGSNNPTQGPSNQSGSVPCTCQLMARPFQRLWIFGFLVPHALWDVIDENGNETIVSGQSYIDKNANKRILHLEEFTPDKSDPKSQQNKEFLAEKRGAHSTGAPIHDCAKAQTLLHAPDQFPKDIHYRLFSVNSNRAAHWLGILIGEMTPSTRDPSRALGFSNGSIY